MNLSGPPVREVELGNIMKPHATIVASVALAATLLAGCAPGREPTRQELGTGVGGVVGAVAGGLAGSAIGEGTGRTAAIIAGSILGGGLGAVLGNRLTEQDNYYAQQTTHNTLNTYPTGQSAQWSNPQSGHSGYVVPTSNTYYSSSFGQDCREYRQAIYVEGEQYETAVGTACRQYDGTWHIVS